MLGQMLEMERDDDIDSSSVKKDFLPHPEYDEVQRRLHVELPRGGVDRVQLLDGVRGTTHVA